MFRKSMIERHNSEIDRRISRINSAILGINLRGIADLKSADYPGPVWNSREQRRNAQIERLSQSAERLERQRSTKDTRDDSAISLATEARLHRKASRSAKYAALAWSVTLANLATVDNAPRAPFFHADSDTLSRVSLIRAEWASIQASKEV